MPKIPNMVEEVHAKFGPVSICVKGETLYAKGLLVEGTDIHALCAVVVDGRPVELNDAFQEETVIFPRSTLVVKDEGLSDITEEFLTFTQTLTGI